jgi:hypothetical protein
MVLTRSTVGAPQSIIKWFPKEILSTVMTNSSTPDLAAFCRTSRLAAYA